MATNPNIAHRLAVACFFAALALEGWWLAGATVRREVAVPEQVCDTVIADTLAKVLGSSAQHVRFPDPLKWAAIDSHALAAPAHLEDSAHTLVSYLCPGHFSDWEKARSIFRWIADRIRYDDAAYNSGRYGLADIHVIFKIRRGVCEDYANLFNLLAELAGFPSRKIIGFTKEFSALRTRGSLEPDHAWSAFYIDGTWHLMDVTWAASFGQLQDGWLRSTPRFEDYWFDTPAEEFIFTHLPDEGRWQLLDKTLSVADFECLPQVNPEFFELGFRADSIREQWEHSHQAELPRVFMHDYAVRKVEIPQFQIIDPDSLQLQFVCTDCKSMTAQTGGRLIDFEQSDSLFCLDVQPRKGPLRIYARKRKNARQYNGIMEYWVRKKRGIPVN